MDRSAPVLARAPAGGHLTGKGDLWTAEVEGIVLPALTLRLT